MLDTFKQKIAEQEGRGALPKRFAAILLEFTESYLHLLERKNETSGSGVRALEMFLEQVIQQCEHPFTFECYHRACREPIDYWQFGQEFVKPLVDLNHSYLVGESELQKIDEKVRRGQNVILLSNHQTECDPQVIGLMLNEKYPELARKMTFVAGDRVVTDPLAVPFSRGCNLLCIYSKKYEGKTAEEKRERTQHNQRTMRAMGELLAEGGHCIYVASSGGRDRPDGKGGVPVAPFDPQSVAMFHLIGAKCGVSTDFHPLALATYTLMPPPDQLQVELGESRLATYAPVGVAFGEAVAAEVFHPSAGVDKRQQRVSQALTVQSQVEKLYQRLLDLLNIQP